MRAPALTAARSWVSDVVIGLTLCPWAQPAHEQGRIRYALTEAFTPDALLAQLRQEVALLQSDPSIETTLLVHPHALCDWENYYPWVAIDAEGWLEREGLEEEFQIVGFHPGFCFGGEDEGDASHYTNRSPYPMTHILRQESVEAAIENHPNPMAVPEANKCMLRRLGVGHLRQLLQRCMKG